MYEHGLVISRRCLVLALRCLVDLLLTKTEGLEFFGRDVAVAGFAGAQPALQELFPYILKLCDSDAKQ